MSKITNILLQNSFNRNDLIHLLDTSHEDLNELFTFSSKVKEEHVGNVVYFRGLIEFSNICSKNCYYCGIRLDNKKVRRFDLSDEEILEAALFAYENKFGSVVLQGGELNSEKFTERIENLIRSIKDISNNSLGITLSVGEQSPETYTRWFNAGAHRYLLRIESSNRDLYYKIHPNNEKHSYETRLKALYDLKDIGYQVGTGVMIGLPYQTISDLADDLLFMKEFDIDMCGMGPYIEHKETPLWNDRVALIPIKDRFTLTLKMIAILRILMNDINIASATALQAIDPVGREKALKIGANIIMPNITPGLYRNDYKLYENKPCTDENASDCINCLEARIKLSGNVIGYGNWGDSNHFKNKKAK